MACASFNPNLPIDTPLDEAVWLRQFDSNILNSQCLQNSCGHACLPGNSLNSPGCTSCLQSAGCTQTLQCINCIGIDTDNFTQVYNCTVPPQLSPGIIVAIVIACILGLFLFIVLLFFILYKLKKLPVKTQLWIDRYFTSTHPNHIDSDSYENDTTNSIIRQNAALYSKS
jgi:hypothetical protein